MGSAYQPLEVIWDTGSDYLYVNIDYCDNCLGTLFDSTVSTTYEQVTTGISVITYGDGSQLTGKRVQDNVCLVEYSLESCGRDFSFYGITSQIGF